MSRSLQVKQNAQKLQAIFVRSATYSSISSSLRCLGADGVTVSVEAAFPAKGPGFICSGHVHKTDRPAAAVGIRPCQAGDSDTDVRADDAADLFGHLPGYRIGNRTQSIQQVSVYAENIPLDSVAVGNHAAGIDRRAARDVGDLLAQQAAGAGLGSGNGQIPFLQ